MASIEKRGEGWRVRITRKGHQTVTKTFPTRRDAEAFAAVIEGDIARGTYRRAEGERVTFRELVQRYRDEVTPTKRGKDEERDRIDAILKPESAARPMLDKMVSALAPPDVARWRDKCHRPAHRSQLVIGTFEPPRDRHIGASA